MTVFQDLWQIYDMRLHIIACIAENNYRALESAISSRDRLIKTGAHKYLGFSKPLKLYAKGTFAALFQHPTDEDKLIKITAHKDDIRNSIKSQKLQSPNIVKLYPWDNGKLFKEIPELKSYALIVQKISGSPMDYTSNEFFTISYNGNFEKAKDWASAGGSKQQLNLITYHRKNVDTELDKLAELFNTLHNLQRTGIELSDFDQNIIDNGQRYVIIDLGF